MSTAGRPWAVVVRKESTGAKVVFSVHTLELDAVNCAARLAGFGLAAKAERILGANASPGQTLHAPRRAGATR